MLLMNTHDLNHKIMYHIRLNYIFLFCVKFNLVLLRVCLEFAYFDEIKNFFLKVL